jgi:hypothetical protein
MFITSLVSVAILTAKTCLTNIYKSYYLSILETCFILNLFIVSATLYYLFQGGSSSTESNIANASISFSLFLFICILGYHTYLKLGQTRCFSAVRDAIFRKFPRKRNRSIPLEEDKATGVSNTRHLPTSTLVELREELLANND